MAKENHPDLSKDPHAHKRFVLIQQAYETLKDKNKRAIYDSQFVTTPSQRAKAAHMSYAFQNEDELNEFIKQYEKMYSNHQAGPSDTIFRDSEHARRRFEEARTRMEQVLREQEDAERRRQAFQPMFFWILTGFFAIVFVVNVYIQVKLAEKKSRSMPLDENGQPLYDLGMARSYPNKWDYMAAQMEKRKRIYDILGSQADDTDMELSSNSSPTPMETASGASPITIVHTKWKAWENLKLFVVARSATVRY